MVWHIQSSNVLMVARVGSDPTTSCSSGRRYYQLSYRAIVEHPAGFEPAISRWQREVLPLYYGCISSPPNILYGLLLLASAGMIYRGGNYILALRSANRISFFKLAFALSWLGRKESNLHTTGQSRVPYR